MIKRSDERADTEKVRKNVAKKFLKKLSKNVLTSTNESAKINFVVMRK